LVFTVAQYHQRKIFLHFLKFQGNVLLIQTDQFFPKEFIMQTLITVAMIIFIILLLILAIYLLTHLSKDFLIFKPESTPRIRQMMLVTSVLLFIVAIGGLLILWLAPAKANLITLIAGSIVAAGFALILTNGND
jgi:uncharacterized BrkB/YihY/UPF0761 family membrane protein